MASADLPLAPVKELASLENFRRLRLLLRQITERLDKLEAGGTGGGASSFVGLTDTPENYDGDGAAAPLPVPRTMDSKAGNIPRVGQEADKLEFVNPFNIDTEEGTQTTVGQATDFTAVSGTREYTTLIPYRDVIDTLMFVASIVNMTEGGNIRITHLLGTRLLSDIFVDADVPAPEAREVTGISFSLTLTNVGGTGGDNITQDSAGVRVTGIGTDSIMVSIEEPLTNTDILNASEIRITNIVISHSDGTVNAPPIGPISWVIPTLNLSANFMGAIGRVSFRTTFRTIEWAFATHRPVRITGFTMTGATSASFPPDLTALGDNTEHEVDTITRSGTIALDSPFNYMSGDITLEVIGRYDPAIGGAQFRRSMVTVTRPTFVYDVRVGTFPRNKSTFDTDDIFMRMDRLTDLTEINELNNQALRFAMTTGAVQRVIAIRESFMAALRAAGNALFYTDNNRPVAFSDIMAGSFTRALVDVADGSGGTVQYGVYRVNASGAELMSTITIDRRR